MRLSAFESFSAANGISQEVPFFYNLCELIGAPLRMQKKTLKFSYKLYCNRMEYTLSFLSISNISIY